MKEVKPNRVTLIVIALLIAFIFFVDGILVMIFGLPGTISEQMRLLGKTHPITKKLWQILDLHFFGGDQYR